MVSDSVGSGATGMMVSMPVGHRYPNEGPLVTPLGPRGRAWLEAVAEDPSRDLTCSPGGLSASAHLSTSAGP